MCIYRKVIEDRFIDRIIQNKIIKENLLMSAAYEAQLNSIIPSPKTLERGNGGMTLPRTFCVKHQPFALAASTLCACVKTLFDCELESSDSGIVFALDESIPKSGYALDSRGGNIVLSASGEEGIYYATATLVQMIAEESGELFVEGEGV